MAYDASGALEMDEPVISQPLVKPRALAAARSRVRGVTAVREVSAISPIAVIGFIAAVVLVGLCLYSRIQLDQVNLQETALLSELNELQNEYQNLSSEYEQLFDLETIRNQMEASGNMLQPSDSQVIYMDLSQPDSAETYQDSSTESNPLVTALDDLGEALR